MRTNKATNRSWEWINSLQVVTKPGNRDTNAIPRMISKKPSTFTTHPSTRLKEWRLGYVTKDPREQCRIVELSLRKEVQYLVPICFFYQCVQARTLCVVVTFYQLLALSALTSGSADRGFIARSCQRVVFGRFAAQLIHGYRQPVSFWDYTKPTQCKDRSLRRVGISNRSRRVETRRRS